MKHTHRNCTQLGECLGRWDVQVGDRDLVEVISSALLACWRFRKFTESRWLTVAASTRVLVTAALLGLDDFFQFLKEDSGRADSHRHTPV